MKVIILYSKYPYEILTQKFILKVWKYGIYVDINFWIEINEDFFIYFRAT